MCKEDSEA